MYFMERTILDMFIALVAAKGDGENCVDALEGRPLKCSSSRTSNECAYIGLAF